MMKNNDIDTRVVDFHVHVFPDHVAPRAIDVLFTRNRTVPRTEGTVDATVEIMDNRGVDYAVVQPVATKPDQVKSINDWILSQQSSRLIFFGGIHPFADDPAGEIQRLAKLGVPGVKIQANWQDAYVDEPAMFPIYEAAMGKMMILFHAGTELTPFEIQRATPERLSKVHQMFPDLKMICAHMGGYRMWDMAEEYIIGKNVYLDTSACFRSEMSDEQFVRLIRKHGVERVLFATDLPLADPAVEFERLTSAGLNDWEVESICWNNAKQLLGDRIK